MKSIRLCFVFLLVFHVAFSQTKKLEVGLVAGPSFSFLFGNDLIKLNESKPILRYAFGAKVEYHISNSFALEGNVIYERKGNSMKVFYTDAMGAPIMSATSYDYFDYLSIPVLLKSGFGEKVKFFFALGPSFNILLKNTTEAYAGAQLFNNKDLTGFDNRFDLGLTVGLGFIVPLSERFNFSVELRNNLGLLNTSKLPLYGGGTIQTNSTNLLLGVSYKL